MFKYGRQLILRPINLFDIYSILSPLIAYFARLSFTL